jgi:General secretion pathway protein M.
MIQLSPPMSRLAAVGLLLVVIAAVYSLVIAPLWGTYTDNRDRIAEQQDLLQRYQRLAANATNLSHRLAVLRKQPVSGEGYLQGDNETLVAAQLQSRIRNVVQTSGGKLTSTQVLAGVDEAGFRRIGVRVTMTADITDLQEVLHSLEGARPYLFLDNVDISGEQSRGREGRGNALTVSFEAYGFMRTDSKPAGERPAGQTGARTAGVG